jgi:hypothetical protein
MKIKDPFLRAGLGIEGTEERLILKPVNNIQHQVLKLNDARRGHLDLNSSSL